ncbi:type IV pilus modification PilV family protein [Thermococcus sp.]
MKRRAFVFTLDALLSLVLVVIFITGIVSIQAQSVNVYSTYVRSQNAYTAQNVLELLRTTPLENLVPSQKIEEWISRGILNSSLVSPTMSPLEIAATYWAASPVYSSANLTDKASIILGYILNNTLKGYNYQLIINNYTNPYLSKIGANYLEARDVSAATISLTGYAYNKTAAGYMARLYLAQITKQDEYIYMSDAVLSYPYCDDCRIFGIPFYQQKEVNISTVVSLPSGDKDSATLFFMPFRYLDLGSISIPIIGSLLNYLLSAKVTIRINGASPGYCNGKDYDNSIVVTDPPYLKIQDYSVAPSDTCKLLDILKSGEDEINYEVEPNILTEIPLIGSLATGAIGDSGSSRVIYIYNTSKFKTYDFPHTFYFPDVQTEDPTQIEKALFIPYNITKLEVRAEIENAPNATLYIRVLDKVIKVSTKTGGTLFYWSDNEIKNALNSAGLTYYNLTGQDFYTILVIGLDEYKDIVSPFWEDDWDNAEQYHHIYPPFHLIGNESYVYVGYQTPSYSPHTISLTRSPQLESATCPNGDEWCTDITWSWNLPNVTPVYTKFQFPYFWNKNPLSGGSTNPSQQVKIQNSIINEKELYCHQGVDGTIFCTPNRGILKVFNYWGYGIWTRANDNSIISPTMAPGENKFILDFDDGFYVSKDNSMGETLILLDSYVPYGDTFPYLLQGYPEYTGYNLTYYYEDINGNIKSDNLLIGIPYERNINYKKINIADLQPERYALDDAIVRLFKKLGGQDKNLVIPIKLESTISDVIPLQNVPSLYTPVTVTLRVWRER